MPQVTPCLWFDDRAQEAADFYVSLFPGSKITDVSHYGDAGPGEPGKVLMVVFELEGRPYQLLNGGPDHKLSEAFSLSISCADQAEVDRYWAALTDGGEEGPCGWCKDRYGVSWQVVPKQLGELLGDPDPARSQRAMQAMLQMRKLDVAQLQAAADAG
jgi:predicted 3-demethylubiquinone-9 3-methyltransferase (glyoxalase superfamily)